MNPNKVLTLHEEYMANFSNFLSRGQARTWAFFCWMRWTLLTLPAPSPAAPACEPPAGTEPTAALPAPVTTVATPPAPTPAPATPTAAPTTAAVMLWGCEVTWCGVVPGGMPDTFKFPLSLEAITRKKNEFHYL